jgi:hypothetical protein
MVQVSDPLHLPNQHEIERMAADHFLPYIELDQPAGETFTVDDYLELTQ